MIAADRIKALRVATGAGLVDCGKALAACLGHADLAAEWLRVRGQAIACPPGGHPRERVERLAAVREKIELTKAAARALTDAGVEVSLKWGATPAGVSLNVAQALVAAGEYDGSAVAYRLLNNAAGEEVVWVLMETSTGRGYIAAWYPPASRMQVITNRPTNPRYEFGLARLRKHEPIEGAVITQDWVSA